MRPSDKAQAPYLEALCSLLRKIESGLGNLPKMANPVRMFIAGGTAVHCYTGVRVSRDVDAVFSHRIAIPQDIGVAWRDPDGKTRFLYFDTQYNDMLGPLHEDAHEDSVPLLLKGLDAKRLDVRLLTPTDLAISKLGRFSEIDRGDIEALAREGLIKPPSFRTRALQALGGYVGNTDTLQHNIEIASRVIEAHTPRKR